MAHLKNNSISNYAKRAYKTPPMTQPCITLHLNRYLLENFVGLNKA